MKVGDKVIFVKANTLAFKRFEGKIATILSDVGDGRFKVKFEGGFIYTLNKARFVFYQSKMNHPLTTIFQNES